MDLPSFFVSNPPPRNLALASPEVAVQLRAFVRSAVVVDWIVGALAGIATLAVVLTADDFGSAWPAILFAWMLAAPFFAISRVARRRNRRLLTTAVVTEGTVVATRQVTRRQRYGGEFTGQELDVEFRRSTGELWRFTRFLPDPMLGPDDALDGRVVLLEVPGQPRSLWLVAAQGLQAVPFARPVR